MTHHVEGKVFVSQVNDARENVFILMGKHTETVIPMKEVQQFRRVGEPEGKRASYCFTLLNIMTRRRRRGRERREEKEKIVWGGEDERDENKERRTG